MSTYTQEMLMKFKLNRQLKRLSYGGKQVSTLLLMSTLSFGALPTASTFSQPKLFNYEGD
jgi:hypothetical protein